MSGRPPAWDEYEAILLLDGLLDIKQNGMSRNEVIKRVSGDLRMMAQNRGVEIDELYRNVNGITFQIQSMESAYCGQTIFKPATKLFSEVAGIYKHDRKRYEILLGEAKKMVTGSGSVETHFYEYLASKVSPAQLSAFYPCYKEIEDYCIKIRILKKPLFETTDLDDLSKVQNAIERNKLFRITHRKRFDKILSAGRHYLTYIREGQYSKIEAVPVVEEESPVVTVAVEEPVVEVAPKYEEAIETTNPMTRTEQDNRLASKYPIIFKRMFTALRELSQKNTDGSSVKEIGICIGGIARPSIIEEVLDNASWSKVIGENYLFSTEIVDHSLSYLETESKEPTLPGNAVELSDADSAEQEQLQNVDFSTTNDLAYTVPVDFTYFDEERNCGSSWTELYVSFVATLLEDYPHVFKAGMSFSIRGNGRIEFATQDNYRFMIAPKFIPESDYVLETNISASDIANKCRYLLDLCGVDYENVVITYKRKETETKTEEKHEHSVVRAAGTKFVNSISFARYMKDELKMAETSCRSYASAINNCESFAREHGFSSWRLYTDDCEVVKNTVSLLLKDEDFLTYNRNQHNRFRAALSKLLLFIGAEPVQADRSVTRQRTTASVPAPEPVYRNEEYTQVLKNNFSKGFRMESALEIRKFRLHYAAVHEQELADSDELIAQNIKRMCILYDGKAFLPEVMLSEELKDSLLRYIAQNFESGKKAIYFQALFNEFSDAFLDYQIHDADMLKIYLLHLGLENIYFSRSFLSQEPDVEIDPQSEIETCLKEHARPMEYEELFAALPHLPQEKIKFILRANNEFISNKAGTYFHESSVVLTDEELENIAEIISYSIEDKEFIGGNELYDAIKAKYPYIIENNSIYSVYGFRDALKYKFGDRFSFKGNIISRAGQELSMADVYANYAKHHDSFTLVELQSLASELATIIYFDSVYENALRISKEDFVSKTRAQFAVSETDAAIDRVCTGNYISIQEITNFGVFPYVGFPWNSYLLEHYVAEYSHKYQLLHSGFNGTECAGAIVKRNSGIETFDDFIVDFLANSNIELNKVNALQLLSDRGYLARRRYSNIESLIIKANAQRNRKDTD